MKILVTGATGFIGSHLVRRLLDEKHTVYIYSRKKSNFERIQEVLPQIHVILIDKSHSGVKNIFSQNRIDGVIHLAGFYRKIDDESNKAEMDSTNIEMPLQILSLAKKYKCTFFINAGSCFEYKQSTNQIKESSPLLPFNHYASTKIIFEKKMKEALNGSSMKALTLKLFFLYGERDNDKLVKLLVKSIVQKKQIQVTKGEQKLSFTYIADVIDAFLKAIEYVPFMKKSYEEFVIGAPPIRVSSIFDLIEEISGVHNCIVRDKDYTPNEIMTMYTMSEKARRVLGWKPNWSLRDGLEKVYTYYKSL